MSATISAFKLFLHCQQGAADGNLRDWRDRLGVVPQWVKVFRWAQCGDVKRVDARIKTLLRVQEMSEDSGAFLDAGEQGGIAFVETVRQAAGAEWQYVDALEFMNEKIGFEDEASIARSDQAALGFVHACQQYGKLPVIHNAGVTCPRADLVAGLIPSTRAALDAGGYYAEHDYGPYSLFDQAALYVECYRAHLSSFAAHGLTIHPARVLLTEFGHDRLNSYRDAKGSNSSGPWREMGVPIEQLQGEYENYHRRLAEFGLGGAFMYNWFGFDGEQPFELQPEMLGWYGSMLAKYANVPADPPPPDPPPTIPPASTVYVRGDATPYVNLRSAPRVDASTDIGDLYPGARLTVLEQSGDWLRVQASAAQPSGARIVVQGWVLARYTQAAPP